MKPFASDRRRSVASLGEERLIARVRRWLGSACPPPPAGIGDDCAVLPAFPPGGGSRLVTVDPVVYGRHFDDCAVPRLVGEKLLKRSLSDLAAMGGRPEAAVVALALDARVSVAWLEGFYRGLAACARKFQVAVVGGDLTQADGVLAASLTLLGSGGAPEAVRARPKTIRSRASPRRADSRRILLRTGSRIGDHLYVTGVVGGSVSGGHHYSFTPRLNEGAWLAGRAEVRAMMDVSDGLAKDLKAMVPGNGRPAIFAELLPIRRGADLRSALGEGEDYELLFAVDRGADLPEFEAAWRRAFPRLRLSRIGRFVPAGARVPEAVPLERHHGYEHLR
ncbi:MAG: thiamine-phosphate kinase [Opitutaceae bacterium]